MATYYVVLAGEAPSDTSFDTRRDAEKAARKLRDAWCTTSRVLLRCDHRFPGTKDGPDSERHYGLHYVKKSEFAYRGRYPKVADFAPRRMPIR